MYTVVWFDGQNQHSVCAGKPEAAWEIYWALKGSISKTTPQLDAWLYVTYNGKYVDPESGSQLSPCEFKRIILKKGSQ